MMNLYGKCVSYQTHIYQYTLCPYTTVTQKDISKVYGGYEGTLGYIDRIVCDRGIVYGVIGERMKLLSILCITQMVIHVEVSQARQPYELVSKN